MAITRTQIAKQLLANGGRIGFRIGSDEGDVSGREYGGSSSSSSERDTKDSSGPNPGAGRVSLPAGKKISSGTSTRKRSNIVRPGFRDPTVGLFSKQSQDTARALLGQRMGFGDRFIPDFFPTAQGIGNIFQVKKPTFFDLQRKDFIRELGPKPFEANRDSDDFTGEIPYWAKLGFSSEAEYLASLNKDEEQEPEYVNPLSKLTARIAGSQFAADGGRITSLEDMDREGFLLGGIAKGLKKAVRGIKKLAKSPIGKAALLYAGGSYLSGKGLFGSLKGAGFLKTAPATIKAQAAAAGLSPREFMMGMGGKTPQGPGGILGFIQKNPILSIFGASAAAGLSADEDKNKFDIDSYYASGKLNPSLSTRMVGSDFDFYGGQTAADGGRIGYQEGGDAEPVAKKTMPLLDMDGMEKDYRETGGFVDMGRMERADDVPARLSKNEFVFTADAVRNAGDGNVDKGAEVMYNMMKNLEAGGEVSEESQGLKGAREMFQTSQRLGEVI